MGRNGQGKSMLLKILCGKATATEGEVKTPDDITWGYVPQVIESFPHLSGGQRFHKTMTEELNSHPNILLLDEPTNHLDRLHRKNLIRMLQSYRGTLIIASHDTELLRHSVDVLWHIDQGKITVVKGHYDDYVREIQTQCISIKKDLSNLERQKKEMHQALMREQHRAAQSKSKGEKSIQQRKWPTIVSKAKTQRSEETSGRKKAALDDKKQKLHVQLSSLRVPEVILPKFSINSVDISEHILVTVREGSVGYSDQGACLRNITFSLSSGEHVAITGDNGSGKSTFVKAMLKHPHVWRTGCWHTPKREDIGYLDQHYGTLVSEHSVLESITERLPSWSHAQVRQHLNSFLFRTNAEVERVVAQLSGGEKARLSLAQIAAKTPKLLIVDEITNNLDLETREHVIQVLKHYPGSMIVISHDEDFLKALPRCSLYRLEEIMYSPSLRG